MIYDFDAREEYYRQFSVFQLEYIKKDTREARDLADQMNRQGLSNKYSYYADEVHTICKIINEKRGLA